MAGGKPPTHHHNNGSYHTSSSRPEVRSNISKLSKLLHSEKKANEKLYSEIKKVKEVFETYSQLQNLIQAEATAQL
jgi:uncharacterized protein YlxW (UPF0749 family)